MRKFAALVIVERAGSLGKERAWKGASFAEPEISLSSLQGRWIDYDTQVEENALFALPVQINEGAYLQALSDKVNMKKKTLGSRIE